MPEENEIIGLIAGGGQFPLMIAEAARKQGLRVVAAAHLGETEPSLSDRVNEIVWLKLGQLGQLIKALKRNGVKKALMAGSIAKRRMFDNIRPDLKGLAVISKLAIFHDDDILRAVAGELAKEGIEIVSATSYLPELLAPPGCLTRRRPSKSEKEDIDFGWKVAKELGRLDIGQCVVVRRKTVLAIEAIDGTNETILRGGGLAREKAVVIKVSKPGQDLRFDLPSVGLETARVMAQVRASVLAVEAGKTLIFDRTDMIQYANEAGISIISR
ncbi:MAG TPA: UDP-2,3-diacylglucosamine diphosphatase LpxI [Acidobacteriota bacterium]|nr:UDP-2,3-diacylglucosamine diphosphatase LpxI [Acidobacteriota bacterium]